MSSWYSLVRLRNHEGTVSVLDPDEREISSVRVESLESAGDFVPKNVVVCFPGVPDCAYYRIQIDPENRVEEIFEENNIVNYQLSIINDKIFEVKTFRLNPEIFSE